MNCLFRFIWVSLIVLPLSLLSQMTSYKKEDSITYAYIQKYKHLAMQEMNRTGIPASIKLAQGIVETQSGTSKLVLASKNHFGLKCKHNWTGLKIFHDDDEAGECFRKYLTDSLSYIDQSNYIRNSVRYRNLFIKINPVDYKGWANGLKQAGYATNPKYVKMLIKQIEDWGLQKYTLQVLKDKGRLSEAKFNNLVAKIPFNKSEFANSILSLPSNQSSITTPILVKNNALVHNISPTLALTFTIEDEYETITQKSIVNQNKDTTIIPIETYLSKVKIQRINRRKVIIVPKGTSLLALAKHYNLPYSSILEYNDFKPEANITIKEQYIFINPKKAKSKTTAYHIVKPNESLYDISQFYGVYLKKIQEYNYLAPGMEPRPNEKIYLQDIAPSRPKIY